MKNLVCLAICLLLISGCASTGRPPAEPVAAKPRDVKQWLEQQNRSKKGAATGALVGAVLGAAAAGARGQSVLKGAAVGGAAGAVVGFLVGKHRDKLQANRDEAVRVANYDPSQGYVAQVQEVRFDPVQPKPGETAQLYVRYLVVGPNPGEALQVRTFRGLKYGEDYVVGAGPADFVVPNGGGIVESTLAITLPAKAPQGTYGIEALIEDPRGRFPRASGTGSLYVVTSG